MDRIIESKNFYLNNDEENEIISNINSLLKNFEKILQSSDEMNQTKIFEASKICESMLNLLLKKEKYLLKNDVSFDSIIEFSINNEIIPPECGNFLKIIIIYRNESANGKNVPNDFTSTFLNAFLYFISWFNNNYSLKYETQKPFKIDSFVMLINPDNLNPEKIIKNETDIQVLFNQSKKSTPFKRNRLFNKSDLDEGFEFIKSKTKTIRDSINTPLKNQEIILEELRVQNESLKKILEIVLENNELTKDINEKINKISNKLDLIQSHTEKLLENARSDEEIERIIQAHTSSCIENILENKYDLEQDEQYQIEKIKLVDKFDEEAWNKLSEESQTFLITSKFMYNKLLGSNEIIDYSGICVLVTKALEVEIFKRFFSNFIKYLDKNYHKDYSKYPTSLLFNNIKPLFPERFTMGNIAFVLCYKENYNDTNQQKKNNKLKLMEYCKNCVFSKYSENEIEEILHNYASSIEDIKIKYRNPSAHRNQIRKKDAKNCLDLIIDVEKLLKKMLDSFDN